MPGETGAGNKDELAVTYAALILHDEGLPITADKINAVLAAANIKVQPFWPTRFASILANRNIDDFILNAGAPAAAAPAAAPAAAAGAPAAAAAAPKEEKKKEEPKEEEEDEDMGFGLFE